MLYSENVKYKYDGDEKVSPRPFQKHSPADGLRTVKTKGAANVTYMYDGDKLLCERRRKTAQGFCYSIFNPDKIID